MNTVTIIKNGVADLFWFILGFADMHKTENITSYCDTIGPMPKGYLQVTVIGIIIFPLIFHYFNCFGKASGLVGFLVGIFYPIVWTHVNWLTAAIRKK